MMLVAEGTLDLDAPVVNYLPWWARGDDEEAKTRAKDLPPSLGKSAYTRLERAYESMDKEKKEKRQELPDKERPSPGYVDSLLEQMEDADFLPESMNEIAGFRRPQRSCASQIGLGRVASNMSG